MSTSRHWISKHHDIMMLNDAIMNTTPPESGPFQAFFLTLNSTLPSHLGQALSTARHLSVSDFAKRNVHKDTEWDSTSSRRYSLFAKNDQILRILTLQNDYLEDTDPLLFRFKPFHCRGPWGFLGWLIFVGRRLEVSYLRCLFWDFDVKWMEKKNDQCQMVIDACCLR